MPFHDTTSPEVTPEISPDLVFTVCAAAAGANAKRSTASSDLSMTASPATIRLEECYRTVAKSRLLRSVSR
jgi:hypothetical protein